MLSLRGTLFLWVGGQNLILQCPLSKEGQNCNVLDFTCKTPPKNCCLWFSDSWALVSNIQRQRRPLFIFRPIINSEFISDGFTICTSTLNVDETTHGRQKRVPPVDTYKYNSADWAVGQVKHCSGHWSQNNKMYYSVRFSLQSWFCHTEYYTHENKFHIWSSDFCAVGLRITFVVLHAFYIPDSYYL